MFKRSKVNLSLLLFCILVLTSLLGGCTSIFSAKDEQVTKSIKILIVEFGSGTPIPDMKVDIKDAKTNQTIKQLVADEEGKVSVEDLEPGQSYLFVPSSIYDDGTGDATGVAQVVDIEESTNYVVLETYYVRNNKGANVPVVLQNPAFPHGCEITALTSVLNFYGRHVSKETMVKYYLPMGEFKHTENGKWFGPDPAKKYAGNPADENEGMYAFAPVIENAAKTYLTKKKSSIKVENLTGASKEQILKKVEKGIPVITWVTLDLAKPKMKDGWRIYGTNDKIRMYRNLHVVVITGYEHGKVIVMDPLKGYVAHDENKFFQSFKEMKSQAIVLEK
ncbi:MAG: C39 family peptidase [Kurthia sp.]|nr:C39 family peptidase [Candidatus Kurthia equi]